MKRSAFIIISLLLFTYASNSYGQFWGPPMMTMGAASNAASDTAPKPATPAQIATEITDTLKSLLILDKKSYKKVYKVVLKERRKIYNDSINDMIPDFGGFGRYGEMNDTYKQSNEEKAVDKNKAVDKRVADRNEALEKILTAQQFSFYKKLNVDVIFRTKRYTAKDFEKKKLTES